MIKTHRATKWLHMLKDMASEDTSVIYYAAEILMTQENYRDALTLLSKALSQNPLTVYFII